MTTIPAQRATKESQLARFTTAYEALKAKNADLNAQTSSKKSPVRSSLPNFICRLKMSKETEMKFGQKSTRLTQKLLPSSFNGNSYKPSSVRLLLLAQSESINGWFPAGNMNLATGVVEQPYLLTYPQARELYTYVISVTKSGLVKNLGCDDFSITQFN